MWCALTVFALRCAPPRLLEADQAMAQAIKLDASDAGLLQEMGSLYAVAGKVRTLLCCLLTHTHTRTRIHTLRSVHPCV